MLTLPETKLHLRVDHSDEDTLIQSLMDAAAAAVANYMNVTTVALPAPAPVKSAALLLVGSLYEQRESVGERQFYKNPAFEALLNPYRVHA